MKIKIVFLAAVLMAILCISGNVSAALSGGGTEAYPYLIQSLADFDEFATDSSYWDDADYVRLECDIDLTGRTYTKAVIAPDTDPNTSGFQGTRYSGRFDGGEHIIRNLTIIGTDTNGDGINDNDYVGLFGRSYIQQAEVKNLGVTDVNITGGKYVGAIFGMHNPGPVRRCFVKGIINGYQHVGGISGYADKTLDCYTDVNITANSYCGGIAGGSIDAVGYCLALGTVTSTVTTYAGKLVGYNSGYGIIFDCIYNSESGGVTKSIGSPGYVSNNKGFTISQLQDISNYLSSGWDFVGETANGQKDAWYMPASDHPRLVWEAGYIEVPFVNGVTEAAATTILNYRGFNTTIRQVASMTVPQGSVCGTLPGNGSFRAAGSMIEVVVSAGPLGDGSLENPYRISSASDIDAVDDNLEACYLLASDIDLGDNRYGSLALIAPISNMADPPPYYTTPFSGTFDGGSHTISNLFFSGFEFDTGGLIGKTTPDAVVRNLRLNDALIVSVYGADVGGLVGTNYGEIYQCSVNGRIYRGAGISLANYGLIEQCFSACRIGGGAGLVYTNYNDIYNCYSQGTIHSGSTGGGLCYSLHSGTITNCYAAVRMEGATKGGLIYSQSSTNMIENCWWDTSVSGVIQSDGGAGRSTGEMWNMSLYAGWGDGVWTINNGYDYPRLAWENIVGTTINNPAHNYGGGSGTAGDPYLIYTTQELDSIWQYPSDWAKQFKVMADIELGGFNFHRIGYGIGFNGTFDGNGHTIRNLNSLPWYATDYKGLFSSIRQGGTIKNLTMENPYEFGDKYFGPIAASNAGTVSNCHVINATMRVLGHIAENTHSGPYQYIGGIAGINIGLIENCSASGNIYGDDKNSSYIGGIAGYNNNGTIENCTFNGLTGYAKYCGGIAGANGSGVFSSLCLITNCTSSVETFAGSSIANDYIGGLVGNNIGIVQNCLSSGIVRGQDVVGGLVGGTGGTDPYSLYGKVFESNSSCAVTGTSSVGGLFGQWIGGAGGGRDRHKCLIFASGN